MDENDSAGEITDPEDQTQDEIREEAANEGQDPITKREGLESELLEEGASEEGSTIGDEMP